MPWLFTGLEFFIGEKIPQAERTTVLSAPKAQLDFYKRIKKECPETVFHGTDVGHIRETGEWYLNNLEKHGMKGSREYELTEENILQDDKFYAGDEQDSSYREKCMVKNFIRIVTLFSMSRS